MTIMDSIKVERHECRWHDEEDDTFMADIGFLETKEQYKALNDGIMLDSPEWLDFDSKIFFWIVTYLGESIDDLYKDKEATDFYVIPKEDANE